MSMTTDRLLNAREAATHAERHINTIRRWIKRGYLPDKRMMPAGRYYLISQSDLDNAMQLPSRTKAIDTTDKETP